MVLNFRKKAGTFLIALNILLLVAAWVMALYAYPRIPATMAAPLSVLGLQLGSKTKSVLFYLCPVVQTLITMTAVAVGRVAALRSRDARLGALRQEHIYMGMVFVNVIFIHLERNVISLAYLGRSSLNTAYFITLAVIVFLIYLYYRVRLKTPSL
jgi:uncharacterized membrane protein